jgi:hypothetical protein
MPLTGGLARIDDELHRACDGDSWHGPPLREVQKGVTAAMAAAPAFTSRPELSARNGASKSRGSSGTRL